MRIDDAVDFSAFVASKFTTFQSEIFSVILSICLTENSVSRMEIAALAGEFVGAKVKAAQKAQETPK